MNKNTPPFEALVFDLDGTLIDSVPAVSQPTQRLIPLKSPAYLFVPLSRNA